MSDCLFCKIVSGEIPADIVHQDKDCVAFRDINPQSPTHVLIVPRKHIPTLNELEADDAPLVGRLVLVAQKIAQDDEVDQDGYRLVWNCQEGAGQSVFHIHLHLLGGRKFTWPPG
ncbi:histidine triad nucleotide-binding protein [bacterium]|nr:histidine triad nucleotide-binding protein [bacterium]